MKPWLALNLLLYKILKVISATTAEVLQAMANQVVVAQFDARKSEPCYGFV